MNRLSAARNWTRTKWQARKAAGWRPVGKFALYTVNVVCLVHLFAEHVGWFHMTYGPSMMPTLAPTGEAVIENRLICVKDLRRGDIITYASPAEPGRVVCKRIVGLPGDVICVDPTGQMAPTTEHVVVPKGHFWMCGDNAMWSRDSRWYGPVSQALVKGKLVAKIWPPSQIGRLRNNFKYIDE
ncbi:LexA/Signal peptidase [Trametopsis cervina]|nr:LexA/Signal peptidase [Trametopsis cervina]